MTSDLRDDNEELSMVHNIPHSEREDVIISLLVEVLSEQRTMRHNLRFLMSSDFDKLEIKASFLDTFDADFQKVREHQRKILSRIARAYPSPNS